LRNGHAKVLRDAAKTVLRSPDSQGLERSNHVGEHVWLVTFMQYDLGYFDDATCRVEPINYPFGSRVLLWARNKLSPMCPEWTVLR